MGFEWTYAEGRVRPGDAVLILGPGQQGLGCVIAAKSAGAGVVIVTGLPCDKDRLDVARALGPDHTLFADDPELVEKIGMLTDSEGADLVIDTAAGNETTIGLALDATRKRGRVVLAATTVRPLKELEFFKITRKYLSVLGVRGHSYGAVEWAIDLISAGHHPLQLMSSLEVDLEHPEQAILGTAGELDSPVIQAAVVLT